MGTASGQRQGEVQVAKSCCSPLAVTPMRHKGLLGWRYDSRCNYMITLVTEPRRPIFGILREWGVERNEVGKAVYDAWQAIEARFPGVRATYNAIMPDHFHGIVYVTAEGCATLEDVVSFFAAESERRIGRRVWCGLWRDTVCTAKGQLHRQINYVLANPRRRWIKENNREFFTKTMGFRHWRLDRADETLASVDDADSWDFRAFSRDGGAGAEGREYWDLETGEEIAKPRKGNKVQQAFGAPDMAGATASEQRQGASRRLSWAAMGNPFLMEAPLLVSVRISTLTPPEILAGLVQKLVEKAERGAVLVSPWVSPGEKAVKAEALAHDGRVVQILPEGMGRYYKPGGGDFCFCSEGRMLLLSPFEPRKEGAPRVKYGKPRFEWLNLAARAMADIAIGFSRAQLQR